MPQEESTLPVKPVPSSCRRIKFLNPDNFPQLQSNSVRPDAFAGNVLIEELSSCISSDSMGSGGSKK